MKMAFSLEDSHGCLWYGTLFLLSLVQYTDICGLDFTYVWPGLWQLIIAFSVDSLSLNASRGGWVAKRLSSCHDVSMRLNLFTSSVAVVGGPCLRNCVQQGGVWFTTVLATPEQRQLFQYSAMCSGSWSSTGGRKHISVMWSIVGCWYTKCARTKHRITVQGFYALDITIRSPASLPGVPWWYRIFVALLCHFVPLLYSDTSSPLSYWLSGFYGLRLNNDVKQQIKQQIRHQNAKSLFQA